MVAALAGLLLGALALPAAEFGTQSTPARDVEIILTPAHEHHRDRVVRAAAESLTQYELWLGRRLTERLTIRDTAPGDAARSAGDVLVDLPWLAAPGTMEVEAAVAHAIAMQYWPHDDRTATFVTGLASYLQGRVVERLFNAAMAQPGHSVEGARFFGGQVPWSFRSLRISRWGDSVRRERLAAAFAALERYLSWPVLQGALRALAADAQHTSVSVVRAVDVLGAAAGQDLRWFFESALGSRATVDYGLTNLVTGPSDACGSAPCVRSRVTVQRHGNAAFTGTSLAPAGPYESGKGIVVEMRFADGTNVVATWDGRAAERTFEFESAVPASAVRLDPEGTLLLDPTRSDHSLNATPDTNVSVTKWIARWLVWVQDAMLTYTAML
jgi:hypothetical protein